MKHNKAHRSTYTALIALTATAALLVPQVSSAAQTSSSEIKSINTSTAARAADPVDNFPTPTPTTTDCDPALLTPGSECNTIAVPLDYDEPDGDTTNVAYYKIPATNQANKIGTLFLNPGGPGASAILFTDNIWGSLDAELREKFDIIGMDPRGIQFSDNVQCFSNEDERLKALDALRVNFPVTESETSAYLESSRAFGKACSTQGKPLSGHMSTANVARDMDVLRRIFGEEKLNYLGFSYGSYLGNVYANLFPDRVRAVAIDGVLDPVAWAGTPQTRDTPAGLRMKSGIGAKAALDEILRLCEEKGPQFCIFASKGDPKENYLRIVEELKKNPVSIQNPITDKPLVEIDYPGLIQLIIKALYSPVGPAVITFELTYFYELLFQQAPAGTARADMQEDMRIALFKEYEKGKKSIAKADTERDSVESKFAMQASYNNYVDAFQTVVCTDSMDPLNVEDWPQYADQSGALYGGFGRAFTWSTSPCAESTWTQEDNDSYHGPFTRSTENPVLVVGNFWDPATNYIAAQAVAKQLPNSRLLSSNNFGHTAYATSACATNAVNTYLLTLQVPPEGTVCESQTVPFTNPLQGNGEPIAQDASPQEALADVEANLEDTLTLPPNVLPQPVDVPGL